MIFQPFPGHMVTIQNCLEKFLFLINYFDGAECVYKNTVKETSNNNTVKENSYNNTVEDKKYIYYF
jgi:hypothetical protein